MSRILKLLALSIISSAASAQSFVETDFVDMPELEPAAPVDGKLGTELVVMGNTVLVSAPQAFDYDGAVFAFDLLPDGQLQFRQRLQTDSDSFRFGSLLAADGDHAVAGQSGSKLRFYHRTGTNWQQTQLLEHADVPTTPEVVIRNLNGDLSMSGDLLAIGNDDARMEPSGSAQILGAGAVVLYRRDASGEWQFEAVVTAPTPTANASFGSAVAVSGNTLLVGASGEGKAYVAERIDGQWQQPLELASPGDGEFGRSVALEGNVAVVGRRIGFFVEGPSNTGSFRAYERNLGGAGQWGQRGEYASTQAGYIDNFSASLTLHDGVLLVGSPGNNIAVFFTRDIGGGWLERAVLDLNTTSHDFSVANFGAAVGFNGLRAVVGASNFPDFDVIGTSGPERWGSIHAWTSEVGGGVVSGLCGSRHPFDVIYCDGYEGGAP